MAGASDGQRKQDGAQHGGFRPPTCASCGGCSHVCMWPELRRQLVPLAVMGGLYQLLQRQPLTHDFQAEPCSKEPREVGISQSCPTSWVHRFRASPRVPSSLGTIQPQLYRTTSLFPHLLHVDPAISSSVVPFSSCPQSLPASESFPMSQLLA